MSTEVHISKALPENYAAIADIYNEHIQLGKSSMEESLKTPADIAGWVDNFNARERLFVLKNATKVIGWAIIKRYSERHGYRFACETAVYLTQSEVGKGYGTRLKKHLLSVCKSLEYHHLIAKIFADNEESIRYNEKLGYTIVGRQNEIGFKNGKWQDIVIMQYLIK